MVHRYESILIEKAFAFSFQIGEQRFDLAPIAFAAANTGRTVDDVDGSGQVQGCRVQLMIDQHGGQTLVGRYTVKGDARRRRKSRGATMTQLLCSLHIPVYFVL